MRTRDPGRPTLALAVGWAIAMVAIARNAHDGFPSIVFGPFVAAFCDGVVVGVVWLLGRGLLLIPPLARLWRECRAGAALVAIACLAAMAFGSSLGLTEAFADPDSGRQFVGLHSGVALSAYALLLFIIANWPSGDAKAAYLDEFAGHPPRCTTAWPQIGALILAWARGRAR